MILLDTGGLYALLDASEPLHERCARAVRAARPPRLLSPFVLAELDYLLGRRVGPAAQLAFLEDVARGAWRLEPFEAADVEAARQVMLTWRDLPIGLADASIVVLSHRHGTVDLLGTDQRHFRALRGHGGRAFRMLPYDDESLAG